MPADLAVLGLDHLGLSAAQAATALGIETVGFTTDPAVAAALRTGRPPTASSLTAADLRRMLAHGFTTTSDPTVLGRVRTVLICPHTSLAPDRTLDLDSVQEAARALAPRLRRHTLVVLESPVRPGTTEELVRPLLEQGSKLRAGRDFHLAYSPSRADCGRTAPHDRDAIGGPAVPPAGTGSHSGGQGSGPGAWLGVSQAAHTGSPAGYGSWPGGGIGAAGVSGTGASTGAAGSATPASGSATAPRVIGGLTPACTEAAVAFYGRLAGKPVRARGTREAETVKMLETNLRQVTTALVNEMAFLCHDLDIDLWDVLRCTETGPTGAAVVRRGPGPGGPGTAVDPGALPRTPRIPGYPIRMVELAQDVNDRMPRYIAQRAGALLNEHGKSLRGARLLLLGVTGQPDSADQEGAPAREVATLLQELGARLTYHDPYVPRWSAGDLAVPRADALFEAASDADLTLLLQHHSTYDLQGIAAKAQLLLDTRGATPAGAAHRL